jgi:DNA-binding transcriptional ArsR family regulator
MFPKFSKYSLVFCFDLSRISAVASKLDLHARQLAALGHPARLAILRFVVQSGEDGAAAGDIQSHVDMPASTLSHHLRRLADAGLLASRGEGTFVIYSARYEALRALTSYLWEDCCKRGKPGCC